MQPIFCTVDPLGRFCTDFLSDQAMMELFVDGFLEAKAHFQENEDGYPDIQKWRGLKFDDDGKLTEVYFAPCLFHGSINFSYIPRSVTTFIINYNFLEGTLRTEDLPAGLKNFSMPANRLTGSVNFAMLPSAIIQCIIFTNQFSGSCDLRSLPAGLEVLEISENAFEGELHLDSLPDRLYCLSVGKNQFSGSVTLEALPERMKQLHISVNKLSGALSFDHLPAGFEQLWIFANDFSGSFRITKPYKNLTDVTANNNKFRGTAVVHSSIGLAADIDLTGNMITAAVDENGKEVPSVEFWI